MQEKTGDPELNLGEILKNNLYKYNPIKMLNKIYSIKFPKIYHRRGEYINSISKIEPFQTRNICISIYIYIILSMYSIYNIL